MDRRWLLRRERGMVDDSVVMGKEKVLGARRCVDGGEGARDIWARIKQHWCFGWDGVE